MRNKLLFVITTLAASCLGLLSCQTNNDDLIGGKPAKMVGIESFLYSKDKDGGFTPLPQYNYGDYYGEEETIYLFRVSLNTSYLLRIFPILNEGSIPMELVGDQATISKNNGYEISYYEDNISTSYNITFLKTGSFRLNIAIENFTNKIDIEASE